MAKMITHCTIHFVSGEDYPHRTVSNVLHVHLDNRTLVITFESGLITGIPLRRIAEFYTWQEEDETDL